MPTMHALLAVQSQLKANAHAGTTRLRQLFLKPTTFSESRSTYQALTEGSQPVTEAQRSIQTTITREVEMLSRALTKALDIGYHVDTANLLAKADVIVDGKTLLYDVPAPALLQLGHRLDEIKTLIDEIPTLDTTKGYKIDPLRGAGFYMAREIIRDRSAKVMKYNVMAVATERHPAQIDKFSTDEVVGKVTEQEWSSLVPPATKQLLQDRIGGVIAAVKTARANANEVDIKDLQQKKIGEDLLEFIFSPLYEAQ